MRLYVIRVNDQVVYAATDHRRLNHEGVQRKYTAAPTVKYGTLGFSRRPKGV
jgi:hypothetical protein